MPLFAVTAHDREVYEGELRDFLPDAMVDIHTHVWRRDLVRQQSEAAPRSATWPDRVAADNSVEDLMETYRLLLPGKEVTPLMFSSCKGRESLPACNGYIAEAAARTGYPALYYSHPEQGAEELEQLIVEGGFLGLKSYLDLSPAYIPEEEIRILDFFPHHQLALMDRMKLVVMLHIPRSGRLRDPVNLAQILEIRQRYPDLRLIVAHIGRAYCREDVGDAFHILKDAQGLLFDISANCCVYAMERLLEHVGPKAVLFGSDLPILRMRTRRIEEGGNYVNLVPPGLYGDVSGDSHMREVSPGEAEHITFFFYEELLALKRAAGTLGLTAADVADICNGNGRRLIEEARAAVGTFGTQKRTTRGKTI